jgi:hypothetical protein
MRMVRAKATPKTMFLAEWSGFSCRRRTPR